MSSLPDVLKHFDSSTEVSGLLQVLASGHWFYVFHLEITPSTPHPPPAPPTLPLSALYFPLAGEIQRRATQGHAHTHTRGNIEDRMVFTSTAAKARGSMFSSSFSCFSSFRASFFYLLSATFFPENSIKISLDKLHESEHTTLAAGTENLLTSPIILTSFTSG